MPVRKRSDSLDQRAAEYRERRVRRVHRSAEMTGRKMQRTCGSMGLGASMALLGACGAAPVAPAPPPASGAATAVASSRAAPASPPPAGPTRSTDPTPPMPQRLQTVESGHQSAFPLGRMSARGGWGKIVSVDVARREIVFDLYSVEMVVPGDESEGWDVTNNNPLLRTLAVASNAEIRACRSLEAFPPVPYCGNPWLDQPGGFRFWDLAGLQRIIGIEDVGLFKVLVDPGTGEVIWIEQWWSP